MAVSSTGVRHVTALVMCNWKGRGVHALLRTEGESL